MEADDNSTSPQIATAVQEVFMAPTLYRVDRDDTLVHVGEAWDEFARSNGAPDYVGAYVLGRPIWAYVSGPTTRLLYREIMNRVRARKRRIVVPFRCDSPTLRRFMRLTISTLPAGSLQFEAETIRTEAQSAPIWARAGGREPTVETCSWCKRIKMDTQWVEAEEAVGRLDLLHARPAAVTHGICEACTSSVLAALGHSREMQSH